MNSAEALFQKAFAAFSSQNFPEAERGFTKVLDLSPDHIGALNLLTVVLMSMERFEEAEKFISKAARLDQSSDVSFYNYGLILKKLGRSRPALKQFTRALELKSTVPDTWNNRGTVLNDLQQYENAIIDFDKAISLNPSYAEAHANKGRSLGELKRYDAAVAAYDAAIAIRPDLESAWLGRGDVLWKLRRYDEALASYDRAMALRPDLKVPSRLRSNDKEGARSRTEKAKIAIVIPTLNSQAFIDIITKFYSDLKVPVHVFVDSKTTDATYEVAKTYATVELLDNKVGVVEESIEEIAARTRSEWVLRIDDDELPSKAMMQFVHEIINSDEMDGIDVVSFKRLQCVVSKGGALLASREISPEDHAQHRLFRPSRMKFRKDIHTAGYEVWDSRRLFAPNRCLMIHLDWTLHSYAERRAKVERYDQHTRGAGTRFLAGAGTHFRSFYLYEETKNKHPFCPINRSEFDSTAAEIRDRFFDQCFDDSASG